MDEWDIIKPLNLYNKTFKLQPRILYIGYGMAVTVKIKKNDYGMTYTFTIKNVDLSLYTAKLYVWQHDTILIDGATMTAVTYTAPNSIVYYTPVSGVFSIVGEWDAVITFTGTGYKEQTETFVWEVLESYP